MSVSSHLSPEPERRLWIIHAKILGETSRTDLKLWALTAFAAAQMALVETVVPGGRLSHFALALLCVILPIGLLALSPLIETNRQVPLLDPRMDGRHAGDCLISAHDIAKYPQIELVILFDRYLGGGVTATQYYEDIVGHIVSSARIAVRKRRLFLAATVPAVVVQLGLLCRLIWR
ncbi:MAG: hypothetical protein PHV36_03070 [Elusimicrobiales bacterium]|nr:hypothetical protein [Elusimicrobiales bacterium]